VGVGTATNGRSIGSPGSGLARQRTPSTQESSNSSTTLYTEEIETAYRRDWERLRGIFCCVHRVDSTGAG